MTRLNGFVLLFLSVVVLTHFPTADARIVQNRAGGNEISLSEAYVFAENKAEFLSTLVPGSEDYYFYHTLYFQNKLQLKNAERMIYEWENNKKRSSVTTQRLEELKNRQALLMYDKDPGKTLAYLKKKLGLGFNHFKKGGEKQRAYPSSLDNNQISTKAITKKLLSRRNATLSEFTKDGLYQLNANDLNMSRLRELLRRLDTPDYPNLVNLLIRELKDKKSSGFGAFPIHRMLTIKQMDQLNKKVKGLISNKTFVAAYIQRIMPKSVIAEKDTAVRLNKLNQVWQFVKTLPQVQNSLKLHVLHDMLKTGQKVDKYDKKLFVEYLKVPRISVFTKRALVSKHGKNIAQFNTSLAVDSGFTYVADDRRLVDDYLNNFLVNAKNYNEFLPYLEEKFLKQSFAEIKILNGIGDKKKWFAQLPANKYEELNQRVELRILPKNKVRFKSNDQVELQLDLKNIDSLVANIYEINSENYYKKHADGVDISINLEGLQANHQSVIEFDKPSHLRHGYNLLVPQASKAGVYVIDLVGNGINSRAVVIKGGLNYTQREGVSGHLFRIYDENNNLVKDGSIWLKGHNYTSDKNGRIIVPFTKQPTMQDIVISANGMSSLHKFYHNQEQYQLKAAVLFNQEALISSNPTEIVINPQLLLNQKPIDNTILKDITVELKVSKPGSGAEEIVEKKVYTDLELEDGKDLKIPFTLIKEAGAVIFQIEVSADVENISLNKTERLSYVYANSISYDAIANRIGDAYLRKINDDYLLELIGRNGENIANHSVQVEIANRNFSHKIRVNLQSDAAGEIDLGELKDIKHISVNDATGINRGWSLYREVANLPDEITVKSGESLILPNDKKSRSILFQLVDGHFLNDLSEKISQKDSYVEIRSLEEGSYIYRSGNNQVSVTVENGIAENGFILAKDSYLQHKQYKPLLVTSVDENSVFSNNLVIKTKNADDNARVHIIGSRFINDDLARIYNLNPNNANGGAFKEPALAKYSSGRRLSDELRYIMERKLADKYPGNMLKRPSLIMKPLEFGKTTTSEKTFKTGGEWDEAQEAALSWDGDANVEGFMLGKGLAITSHDYNFLAGKSLVLLNQTPDKNGEVKIDLSKLAGNQHITVVATNGSDVSYAHYYRSKSKSAYKDIRQKSQFISQNHYRQENSIKAYDNLSKFDKDDSAVSDYEIYSSVFDVYALYKAINSEAKLDEFRFLLSWDDFGEEEKQHKYSSYASHELNFYLYQRDKKFFDKNIKPVISNKLKKDFIDDWLLHNDLLKYTSEYQYSRLNVIEKALLAKRVKWQKDSVLTDLTETISSREKDYYKHDRLFEIALTGGVDSSAEYSKKDALRQEVAKAPPSKRKARRMMKPMAAPAGLGAQNMAKMQFMAEAEDRAYEKKERRRIEQFYTAPDKTKSWIEQRYYGVLPNKLSANYINLNDFWVDYINSKKDKVLSSHIALPTNNLTEMIFALALVDLPVNKALSDGAEKVDTATSGIVFAKLQYKESKVDLNNSILLGQNIFPKDQRYKYIDNKKQENFLEGGFVKGKIYGMQTVITNTTSLQEIQELFIQIPQGAVPVGDGFYSKSMKVSLDPFATKTIENYFYFPKAGDFTLYPAHAFNDSGLMSFAKGRKFTVYPKAIIADKRSWDYISQNGSKDQQIEFVKNNNLKRIDLNKIAYRYKDKGFFLRLLKVLKEKHHYDATFWSYAIKHNITEEISNYLHINGFAKKCGDYLSSKLIKIHSEDSGSYLHKEFWPLINKRVFQFGNKRYIENKQLLQQYNSLMQLLSYKGSSNSYDALVISYYLLLQDRVAHAEKWFAKVDKKKVYQKMPYDYMAAYLAFYNADVKQAYSIAERYSGYPLEHWRDMFVDILSQAKQVNQTEVKQAYSSDSLKDRQRLMFSFASDDPLIDIKTSGEIVQLRMKNIKNAKLNFYAMDLEVLFSRKPFAMQLSDQFGMIQPNISLDVEVAKDKDVLEIDIPEELKGKSLLVEAKASGVSESVNYYPNTLVTHINDKYGIARINTIDGGKPLSAVYVKVYARFKNGKVKFYKDGYTDLRGVFDYLSQNDDNLEQIERFSILILSDDNGALIKEVSPPKI